MRIEIGRVRPNQPIALPIDNIEISNLIRGQLAVKVRDLGHPMGGMSDVQLLDSGQLVCLSADVEVEVFEP